MTEARRVALSTGIGMNVVTAGREDAPPAIFLHGFPESHRTWRRLVPLLGDSVRMIIPDLRGFAASDKPKDVAAYATEALIADVFALADALRIQRFALVGHDWGGAIAWAAALRRDPRVERLVIVNSPHPLLFQKSLIEHPGQRAASQYINAFRDPAMADRIAAMGVDTFFDKSFAPHIDLAAITPADRQAYLDEWSQPGALKAMLNWYRASRIHVPRMGEDAAMPAWVAAGIPKLAIPLLVVWGMEDKALLPVQLEGMADVGSDVTIVELAGVGHFAPWEAPGHVASALRGFL